MLSQQRTGGSPAKEGAVNEGCQVDHEKLVLDRDLPEVDGLECRPYSQLRKVGGPEVLLNLPFDSLHMQHIAVAPHLAVTSDGHSQYTQCLAMQSQP